MQFIGSDDVFAFLNNVSLIVSWDQFRTDGSVDDVLQDSAGVLVLNSGGNPADKMPHKCFGDRSVDAIHAHVITIVCCPSKGQLTEVSCSNYHSIHLVGCIHENLGAFTCLAVFVGYIVYVDVMTDIVEMLCNCVANADFSDGNAK